MPDEAAQQVQAARAAFPTGLFQPEGGYRFSLDPLLLASFARPKKGAAVVDIGTGCGVAALAALLTHPSVERALGLDIDPAMTDAAARNAALLGLADRFAAVTADVRSIRERPRRGLLHDSPEEPHPVGEQPGPKRTASGVLSLSVKPESFDLALCNPPYRRLGTGLACREQQRTRARFEAHASLDGFMAAASWLLRNRGKLAVVFPAARLPELLCACEGARLAPKRLRMVHSRLSGPARLVLLEAVKNAGRELVCEPPLELYEGRGEDTRLLADALEFCPFLACNI
jgi:tRNA1Val (adenine37-N6)-methyltransferase